MPSTVKFWDRSRLYPIPVAIDFLVAETLPDAIMKATERVRALKRKHRAPVGYSIEDERGHSLRSW
jgi:hypothetical protein